MNPTPDMIHNNLFMLFHSATHEQIAHGLEWYSDASAVAHEMTRLDPSLSLESAASIISAFSPRCSWSMNKSKALRYAARLEVRGLRSSLKNAASAKILGFNALNGLKTNAFARNIAGDLDAVTVDSWMMRAAGFPKGKISPTPKQYRAVADAIRKIARDSNLAPAQVQAIIWIVCRGRHE